MEWQAFALQTCFLDYGYVYPNAVSNRRSSYILSKPHRKEHGFEMTYLFSRLLRHGRDMLCC